MVASALIGGAASIIGGMLGKDKGENTWEVMKNQIAGWRELGEQYGFNPLALIGQTGTGYAGNSSNYMGEAIADAGLMLADAVAKRKDAQKVSGLERRNRKLQEEVQSLTLRPKVGGIYAQRQAVPTLRQALGKPPAPTHNAADADGGSYAGVVAGAVASGQNPDNNNNNRDAVGLTPNPIASGRPVEVAPLTNTSGVFDVENAFTGGPVTIPGDGEPWGIDEAITAAIFGGPQVAKNWAVRAADYLTPRGPDGKPLKMGWDYSPKKKARKHSLSALGF